jgi:hypothetical protein
MQRAHIRAIAIALAVLAFLAATARTHADIAWKEADNGELSGNGNAPTPLGIWGPGTHTVMATSGSGDIDDFTFTIPAGLTLQSITNSAYSGLDETAFIGLAPGNTINHAIAPTGLIGYQHFGPAQGNTGTDLLQFMGGPQGPGNYSIWWQQASSFPSTVQLDFVVTPEPASALSLGLLAVAFTTTRRRVVRPKT